LYEREKKNYDYMNLKFCAIEVWKHFVVSSGSRWAVFGVSFGSVWGQFGVVWAQFEKSVHQLGFILGRVWDNIAVLFEHVGIASGSFLGSI